MTIRELKTKEEFESAFVVLKELRPHLTQESYFSILAQAQREGYKLVAALSNQEIRALMGYRWITDFVRGRHIYVDDLVTRASYRSQGLGQKLLHHAEQLARSENVFTLRLCTGIENEAGKRFYEREGWTPRALAYAKKMQG